MELVKEEIENLFGKTNTSYHVTLAFAVLQVPVILFVLSTTGSLGLAQRLARWLCTCCRCTCCFSSSGSDRDTKLKELQKQYRMQIAKSAAAVGLLLAAAHRLYQVMLFSGGYQERIQRDLLLLCWEAVLLAIQVLITLERMSWRWMNSAYVLLMLIIACSTVPGMIASADLVNAICMTWLLRCSILPLTDSVKLVFVGNLVCHLAMRSSAEWTMARIASGADRFGLNIHILRYAEGSLAIDSALSVLSCLISSWLESTTFSIVEKTVEAAMLKNEAKACESLLATFCDAHLFLDAELRFVKDVPNLASMLFRATNNAGTDFMQCLATQDDKDRFIEGVNRPDTERAFLAQAMHLALRDGYGNSIPVECFHVKTLDAHGQMRHLVGLREDGEALNTPRDQTVTSPVVLKSVSETTSQSSGLLDCSEEAFVIFDAVELDIMGVSPHFLDATGLDVSDEAKFSDFVAGATEQHFSMDFLQRLERAVAKAEEEDVDLEGQTTPHFRMQFPMKLRSGRVAKSKWKFYIQQQHEQLIVQGVLIKTLGHLRSPKGSGRLNCVKRRKSEPLAPLPESIGKPRMKRVHSAGM